ncbi:MAG: glycosyltransferase family 2 protein [Balneolaceae bacterium]|nr:glycosyltransferase family 2 protein [Balneolaceae bacterium]
MSEVKGGPLVSILIPTHNRTLSLQRAIDSSLKQTYESLEIIVVDDASSPPAHESMSQAYQQHPSIRWIRQEKNVGAPAARNRGLHESRGEYICFLDDDDEIFPEKIARQVEFLATSDASIFGVTHDVEDERFGERLVIHNTQHYPSYVSFLNGFANTGTEAVLYKRQPLLDTGGFDEDLPSSQEYDLLIRLAKNADLGYLPYILSRHYASQESISLNLSKKYKGSAMLYRRHHRRFYEVGGLSFWIKMTLKYAAILMRIKLGQLLGVEAYKSWIRKGMSGS